MTDKEQATIEAEIQSMYRKSATEQPSSTLDSDIIAQARAHVSHSNSGQTSQSFWRQYRWPLSSAASVLVVVTLFMINPAIQNSADSPQGEPMMMSAPEVATPEPQMMRSMQDSAPEAKTVDSSKSINDSKIDQQASVNQAIANQLDAVARLLKSKQLSQADELLQQVPKQWPSVLEDNHPLHARYHRLQKAIMADH